jgi:Sec-independent protein translocase protein TatA
MVLGEIFGPDTLFVAIIALVLLFGANRLPLLARSLGEAGRELRKGAKSPGPEAESTTTPGETITLSRAELDRLLAERERHARSDPLSPTEGESVKGPAR